MNGRSGWEGVESVRVFPVLLGVAIPLFSAACGGDDSDSGH